MSKDYHYGFTLVEILVSTAILTFGIILLYQSFFISLDAFYYCAHYLDIASEADELLWQAQEIVRLNGETSRIPSRGKFVHNNKNFYWNLRYGIIDEDVGLYRLDLSINWREGRRNIKLTRSTYALYLEVG